MQIHVNIYLYMCKQNTLNFILADIFIYIYIYRYIYIYI